MTNQHLNFVSNNTSYFDQVKNGIDQHIIKKTGIKDSRAAVYRELNKNGAVPINPTSGKSYSERSFTQAEFDLFGLEYNEEKGYWDYATKDLLDFTLKDLIQKKITRIDFFETSTRSEEPYVTIMLSVEKGFESCISSLLPHLYPYLIDFHFTSGINYISYSSFDVLNANFIYGAIKSLKDKGIIVGNKDTEQS